MIASIIVLSAAVTQPTPAAEQDCTAIAGDYRAVLQSPGGELPFKLEMRIDADGRCHAWIENGSEHIVVPELTLRGDKLRLGITHYDSVIEASVQRSREPEGTAPKVYMRGKWWKQAAGGKTSTLGFYAEPWAGYRFEPRPPAKLAWSHDTAVAGRWAIRFVGDNAPAVGVFQVRPDRTVVGTVLTTTGDYRYLAGSYQADRLRLSCFDGAHAFLFDGKMLCDGYMEGDFWSRDTWHDTWTATRDDNASLPDGFTLTQWTGKVSLADLRFPDLDGKLHSLDDPAFRGKARIIEVFGSWCPNCNDASRYLAELDRRYRDRGLRIVGLAFEYAGDFERDARLVRTFARRNGVEYPLLIAGTSDTKEAAKAFPVLDRIRAYPTTILLREDGTVHAVHSGFDGPATGDAHTKLRRRFETMIEELLND